MLLLCRNRPPSVLVQGACLLSGIHGWSWLSAQPSKAVVCLCCIFFFGFTNPIFPFLYASNVGDGAWKCPFVSEFALGRPCDTQDGSSPTPQVGFGEELCIFPSLGRKSFSMTGCTLLFPSTHRWCQWAGDFCPVVKTHNSQHFCVPFLAFPCCLWRELQFRAES